MNKEELLAALQKHAGEHGEVLNSDKSVVEQVLKGLLANQARYGKLYCPCAIITGDPAKDRICPCRVHTKDIKEFGHCLCRLFFAKK